MRYSDMIEGLQILAKYEDVDEPHLEGAEHDIVWAATATVRDEVAAAAVDNPDDEIDVDDERLTREDNERLRELGWFVDPDQEAWAHFC